jgi:hypothetical protein
LKHERQATREFREVGARGAGRSQVEAERIEQSQVEKGKRTRERGDQRGDRRGERREERGERREERKGGEPSYSSGCSTMVERES